MQCPDALPLAWHVGEVIAANTSQMETLAWQLLLLRRQATFERSGPEV
eukprot:SAG31_NODE_8027_length_1538_cov_0.943711_1_plen_48_part_00